jgi:hypothetical protein
VKKGEGRFYTIPIRYKIEEVVGVQNYFSMLARAAATHNRRSHCLPSLPAATGSALISDFGKVERLDRHRRSATPPRWWCRRRAAAFGLRPPPSSVARRGATPARRPSVRRAPIVAVRRASAARGVSRGGGRCESLTTTLTTTPSCPRWTRPDPGAAAAAAAAAGALSGRDLTRTSKIRAGP